jgi:nucleotide-binding universal stress UspA family protein
VILLTVAEMPGALERAVRPIVVTGVPAPGGFVRARGRTAVETRDLAIKRVAAERLELLSDAARALQEAGIEVESRVEFGEPGEKIIAIAKQEDVDVIAMATHGRSGVAKALFGSVAGKVLRSGAKPMILIRPKDLKRRRTLKGSD